MARKITEDRRPNDERSLPESDVDSPSWILSSSRVYARRAFAAHDDADEGVVWDEV